MIKETKILKEDFVLHKFCDVCGDEIRIGLACSVARCKYCKKDLCEKCIGYEENTGGDYRIVYCKDCWNKGENYRPLIEQHENEIDILYEQWRNECKQK
ncbi:MAG: hypothetical protein WC554_09425 [Clostridia bacterium]|jgi:hypothetical protein